MELHTPISRSSARGTLVSINGSSVDKIIIIIVLCGFSGDFAWLRRGLAILHPAETAEKNVRQRLRGVLYPSFFIY
jgi:hypothetical protein